MGTDNLVQFPRWRDWQGIARLMPIAVVTRPGTALAARTAKAANRFRGLFAEAGPRFAFRRPPAFAILDARRDPASATALRAGKASLK
jgi:nicotinate-nucleotide adenylyltransferase